MKAGKKPLGRVPVKRGGAVRLQPSLEAPGVPAPRALPRGLRISQWVDAPLAIGAWPEQAAGTEWEVCQLDLDWLSVASPGRGDVERVAAARRLAAEMKHAPKLDGRVRVASVFLAIGTMTTRFPATNLSRVGAPRKIGPWMPTAYQWSGTLDVLLPRYFRAEVDEWLDPGRARRYERAYGISPTGRIFGGALSESRWNAEAGEQEGRAHDAYYLDWGIPAALYASFAKAGRLDDLVAALEWFERAQGWRPFEPAIYRKPSAWEREPDVNRAPSPLFREALKLKMPGSRRLSNPPLTGTVRKKIRADVSWRVVRACGEAGTHITPGAPLHDTAGYSKNPKTLRMEAAAIRGVARGRLRAKPSRFGGNFTAGDFKSAMERAATYETYASVLVGELKRPRKSQERGERAQFSPVGANCSTCGAFVTSPDVLRFHDCISCRKGFALSATVVEQVRQAVRDGNAPVLSKLEELISIVTALQGAPVEEAERILREASTHRKR